MTTGCSKSGASPATKAGTGGTSPLQVAEKHAVASINEDDHTLTQITCPHPQQLERLLAIPSPREKYTTNGKAAATKGGWNVTVNVVFQGGSASVQTYFVTKANGRYYVCG